MSTSQQSAVFETDPPATPAWKQEVNAKLVAHRTRRARPEDQSVLPGMETDSPRRSEAARAARVAARVAERYSKAPTYSEMLAAEAANAARAAEAAARAAQEAHAAAQAVTDVLWGGLDHMEAEDMEPNAEAGRQDAPAEIFTLSVVEPEPAPLPERIHYHVHPDSLPEPRPSFARPVAPQLDRSRMTDFSDPYEDAVVAPAQQLPVRILEFPRELIASRKARPRLAEGPLLDAGPEPEKSQLRIFEVEPDAISRVAIPPAGEADQKLPEWHSIRLDAKPLDVRLPVVRFAEAGPSEDVSSSYASQRRGEQDAETGRASYAGQSQLIGRGEHDLGSRDSDERGVSESGEKRAGGRLSSRGEAPDSSQLPHSPLLDMLPMHVASMEDRLMAGIVDVALVLAAFLLFILVFVACTAHPPTGKPAIIAAGTALLVFSVLYQWLFFTYAEGTPGMRYAKIALCTFDDENPTRRTLHWRVAALLLSALPLGLGFLWALFDDDRLGWHDRMTRTYQRSYR